MVSPSISRDVREPGDPESIKAQNKKNGPAFQTGSEVDRRLRLMLFLSAHLGEEFSMSELAERFIGKPKNDDELKKFVNIIHKDINTLTTVSDDGEMAGSQFFDIDWPLLDAEGIVSATNSLGLERLAGIRRNTSACSPPRSATWRIRRYCRTSSVGRPNPCMSVCAAMSARARPRG